MLQKKTFPFYRRMRVHTLEQGFKVYWRITFIFLVSQTGSENWGSLTCQKFHPLFGQNLPEYIRRLLTDSSWSVIYISRVLGVVIEFSILWKFLEVGNKCFALFTKETKESFISDFEVKWIMKYMDLVISWSACGLCDPICLNMVSKGQFMLCLVVLDHTKSRVEIFSLFWISPAERFWLRELWSWAWWRGWRRWWSGWWRHQRTSMVRWFHTATKKDWSFYIRVDVVVSCL